MGEKIVMVCVSEAMGGLLMRSDRGAGAGRGGVLLGLFLLVTHQDTGEQRGCESSRYGRAPEGHEWRVQTAIYMSREK